MVTYDVKYLYAVHRAYNDCLGRLGLIQKNPFIPRKFNCFQVEV